MTELEALVPNLHELRSLCLLRTQRIRIIIPVNTNTGSTVKHTIIAGLFAKKAVGEVNEGEVGSAELSV